MSSVVESGKQHVPASPKAGKSDAVRNSLHTHLRKTARFIKIMDLLVYAFAWLGGILALWFVACLIDHWVLPLPSIARWLFWIAGVVGTGVWAIRYVGPLLLGRINESYAAKRIEHLVPEFKNGLISWLELEKLPDHGVPRGVMAALAYRAKRYIGNQDPSATVDTTPLIKLIAVLLLLCTSLIVYAMVSPKSVGVTGKRIAFPWLSLSSPARVEFLKITPGSTEITQGSELKVDVEISGLRRDEPVELRFSTTDGQRQNQIRTLEAVTEGFRYQTTVTTSDDGVQQPLQYWLEAGDAKAGPFAVTINPLPTVVVETVQLTYPSYTGLAPRSVDVSADVEAVEGSIATIQAKANQPMRRGILDINPVLDEKSRLVSSDATVEMQTNGQALSAAWLMRLDKQKTNPTQLQYQVRGFNDELESNLRPLVHSLSVLADLPPEVTLVGPDSRMLRVLPNTSFVAEIRASDPDYGLASIKLAVRKNSKLIGEKQILKSDGVTGQQVQNQRLSLDRMKLKPGDVVQLVAIAEDNRHSPETNQWDPNIVVSDPLLLEIIGPSEKPDIPPMTGEPDQPEDDQSNDPSNQNNSGKQDGSSDSVSSEQNGTEGAENETAGDNSSADSQPKSEQGDETSSDSAEDSGEKGQGMGGSASDDDASSTQKGDNSTGTGSSSSQDSSSRSQSKQSSSSNSDSGQRSTNSNESGGSGNSSQRSRDSDNTESSSSNRDSGSDNLSDSEVMQRVRDRIQQEQNQDGSNQESNGDPDNGQESNGSESTEAGSASDASEANNESGRQPNSENGQTPSSQDSTNGADPNAPNTSNEDRSEGSNSESANNKGGRQDSTEKGSGSQSDNSQNSESSQDSSSDSQNSSDSQQNSNNQNPGKQNQGNQSQSKSGSPSGSKSGEGSQSDASQNQGNQSGSDESSSNGSKGSSQSDSSNSDSSNGAPSQDSSSQPGTQSGSSSDSGSESNNESGQSSNESGNPSDQQGSEGDNSSGENQQEGSSSQEGAGGQSDSPDSRGKGDSTAEQPNNNGQSQKSGGGESSSSASSNQNSPGGAGQDSPQGSAKGGNQPNTGRSTGGGSGSTPGAAGSEVGHSDAASENYAEKTTDMVLDYLDRQKNQPDPELLKDLDWSEQDLQDFVKRWKEARDLGSKGSEEERLQWQEKLNQLGLQPPGSRRIDSETIDDTFQKMLDGGTRARPPAALRKELEAFRKALQQSR